MGSMRPGLSGRAGAYSNEYLPFHHRDPADAEMMMNWYSEEQGVTRRARHPTMES